MEEKPENINEFFAKIFGEVPENSPSKKEVSKALAKTASVMFQEDVLEREAKTYKAEYAQLYPNLNKPGEWVVYVKFSKAKQSQDPMSALMGRQENSAREVGCPSFDYALALLEKNNFFGLKQTRFEEGIFGSWDK